MSRDTAIRTADQRLYERMHQVGEKNCTPSISGLPPQEHQRHDLSNGNERRDKAGHRYRNSPEQADRVVREEIRDPVDIGPRRRNRLSGYARPGAVAARW